jgi:hypothetical protein
MSRRRPERATLASTTALALLLAACFDVAEPSPSPSPSLAPDPTPTVTAYVLDTTVWYAGLELTFGTVTAALDPKGGRVSVDLHLENRGDEAAEVGGPIRLTAGGRGIEPTRDTDLPEVPAGGSADATVTFEVDGTFDVPGSAIRVGRAEEHQAILPLTPGSVARATLEPFAQDISPDGLAGDLFVDLDHLELRADLPDWDQELPAGVLALALDYGATFRGDFATGMAFTAENISLQLPNGDVIGPRRDGRSLTVAILRPARRNHLWTRFEVPVPGDGRYALVISDGLKTTKIPFQIAFEGG